MNTRQHVDYSSQVNSTTSLAQVRVTNLEHEAQFAAMRDMFEAHNPDLRLTRISIDGETTLRSEHGGMRVFWIYRGQGEVRVLTGYRTQEGDGQPLPLDYLPEPIRPAFAATLQQLKDGQASFSPAAAVAVTAILRRWKQGAFIGDVAGDLWKLDHLPRPWSTDPRLESALQSMFQNYRGNGFSTKQVDSYEPLLVGDQLIACGNETLKVRGQFNCLAMENTTRVTSHISSVRRLRYLADTAGGCNPDFDPFRRLPLTWQYNYPGESDDGLNWVNSHVVNIPKETSPAHFHPPKGIGGSSGMPQREMYLVLDPQAYRLNTWGRTASILLWPDLRDLSRCEEHALEPGMFIYIPPGTGHRGLDVFVNVLTIPGFKPHNEYYIDRDIHDATAGQGPFNPKLLENKNYNEIENLL